ncbi:hypothetical protein K7432_007031 [Basidiobolus ranarum]|uniref:Mid2 domain-containing protein n=1 Tax=Basidiobolus ranarum TaxID=34480 RepID=A0ABR2W1N0_9FUNG
MKFFPKSTKHSLSIVLYACISILFINSTDADPLTNDIPCSPQLYCSPNFNVTWIVGSSQMLRWNKYYGTLVAKPTVDIYLYEMSDTRIPLKTWPDHNNEGILPITVTPDYFQEIPNRTDNVNLIRWYKFVVTTQGGSPNTSEAGPIFKIQDNIPTPSPSIFTTVITVTATPSDHVPRPDFDLGSSGVSSKTIGIIIGSILGALAVGALIFFLLRRKNRMNRSTTGVIASEKSENSPSTNANRNVPNTMSSGQTSNTAESSVRRGDSVQSTFPLTAGVGSSSSNDNQFVKLTENEAKLIADAYRKSLRKPGWDDAEGSN